MCDIKGPPVKNTLTVQTVDSPNGERSTPFDVMLENVHQKISDSDEYQVNLVQNLCAKCMRLIFNNEVQKRQRCSTEFYIYS